MIGIKKLDRYILQKFLLIFIGAFFICLFVLMMQFTWRYVDELIGKGLSVEILARFFWYMGITLVPLALPLAVLLASLITFGNLGESLELLSMKAAGVPLIRVMRPMAVVATLTTVVSFYFQNKTSPEATVNLNTLLYSMKQQSPAVDIPEGVFYNGVPHINLFVQKKNAQTGMLYQTIIYKTDQGFERAQIVLADSARLEMTNDKMHLILDLWNGEQFESLQSGGGTQMLQKGAEQPYDRETFNYKQLIIDFDANFNLMDKQMLSGMPQAKDMRKIEQSVDSIELELDSVGRQYYKEVAQRFFAQQQTTRTDSAKIARMAKPDFDELQTATTADKRNYAQQQARSAINAIKSDLEWKSIVTTDGDRYIRDHWAVWHNKMTLPLACLIFFFIGAPLGAIIRKGGLGLPTVISVIIFLIWYVINTSSTKMARDGSINMALGLWISTVIIAPFSVFVTYKANRDSVVFNFDAYKNLLFRLLGIRTKRHLACKEVIIEEPHMDTLPAEIEALKENCKRYNAQKQLLKAPNYLHTFFHYIPDSEVEAINEKMEGIIKELSNSREPQIIGVLNEFPILYTTAHTSPLHSLRMNKIAGIIFPLGLLLWFRIWRFRLRLLRDMRIIVRTCDRLNHLICGGVDDEEGSGEEAEATADKTKRKRTLRIVKWIIVILVLAFVANAGLKSWQRYRYQKRSTPTEQVQPHNENGKHVGPNALHGQ